jgi:hypothetical protein
VTGPTGAIGPTGPAGGSTGPTGPGAFTGPTGPNAAIKVDFTANFGTVPKTSSIEVTQLVAGLLSTDSVFLQCLSTPPLGMVICNTRVSAANTLSISFATTKASNLVLGTLNWRLTIFR